MCVGLACARARPRARAQRPRGRKKFRARTRRDDKAERADGRRAISRDSAKKRDRRVPAGRLGRSGHFERARTCVARRQANGSTAIEATPR